MPNTKDKAIKASTNNQLLMDFDKATANDEASKVIAKVVSIKHLSVIKQKSIITQTVNYIKSY